MADKRRLQGDIDRTLKRVHEGRAAFQDILDKFESASNHTQKEKFEADLKKEIKKLQRLRDQIKTWITSNEIKDKRLLHDARKDIETDMERFKVIEKETKTKAYSKEGLVTEAKRDPLQKEKDDMDEWVKQCISTFQERKEKTEFEIESFNSSKKKRNDREKIQGLQTKLDIQQFHIDKLETILRLLDNEILDIENVKGIKDAIEYYIEQSEDSNEMDGDSRIYYDELCLEELCDVAGSSSGNAISSTNAVPNAVPYLNENDSSHKHSEPTEIATSRSSSPIHSVSSNVSGADSLSVSSSGHGGTVGNQPENSVSLSNTTALPVLSRERRKSEEKNNFHTVNLSKSHGKSAGNTPLPNSGPVNSPLSQPISSGPVLNMSTAVAEAVNPNNASSQHSVITHSSANSSSNGIDSIPNVSSNITGTTTAASSNYSASVSKSAAESPMDLKPKTPTPQVKTPQPPGQPVEGDSPSLWHPAQQQAQPTQNLTTAIQQSSRLPPNVPNQSSFIQSTSHQQNLFHKPPTGMDTPQQNSTLQMPIPHGPADLKAIAARQANLLQQPKSMNSPSFMPLPAGTQAQKPQSLMPSEPQAIILDSKDAIAPFRNRQIHHQQEKIMPQIQALESGFKKLPHPGDTDRARMILYKVLPHSACPPYYPREPPKNADTEEYYMKLDPKTLFFIFYYFEGTKAQHLAAKALKRMSWRFHTKYMMWFQRHEEPKKITDEYESGTYIYYDIESMSQRKKENFMFEYAFLEDKDI